MGTYMRIEPGLLGKCRGAGVLMLHTEKKCAQQCVLKEKASPSLSFPAVAPLETITQSSESKAEPFTRCA